MTHQVGLLIIGSEILSGKREDKHFQQSRSALMARGYQVGWSLIVPDTRTVLLSQIAWAMNQSIPFFSYGGLGATPDDLTRECAAAAAGRKLIRHPEAAHLIQQQFGESAEPIRIRMADLPAGADLIPNPVNNVAGFSLGNGYFFPGFPQMAEPMRNWVLEHYFPIQTADLEMRLLLTDAREGDLVLFMEQFCMDFPEIRFSSLPSFKGSGTQIELGVAGEAELVRTAMIELRKRLQQMDFRLHDLPH
ncbi:MAG: competence/damage-inducible protein A [Acidithiobacillus sp.]